MSEEVPNQAQPEMAPAPPKPQKTVLNNALSAAWEFLKIIIIALVIVLPIRYFLFQPFIVKGDSMVPNFHSGDYLIIDEISYRFGEPKRGDVVVLKYPPDPAQKFIKRIIGLPGETVTIGNGTVSVTSNGKEVSLDEAYLPDSLKTAGNVRVTLKEDEYFVMGDNRDFSYDSRSWGILPKYDIVGKAAFRVLPLTNIGPINQ